MSKNYMGDSSVLEDSENGRTLTTDRNDPALHETRDNGMNAKYLVLSKKERSKGFVRPYRDSYVHVGPPGPSYPLRDLTPTEQSRYGDYEYVKVEDYPGGGGMFWTQKRLDKVDKGCGVVTRMSRPLSETYAREPGFYGATWCCGCGKHLPVAEFVWDNTSDRVGS